jgi:hypothetical protein
MEHLEEQNLQNKCPYGSRIKGKQVHIKFWKLLKKDFT